MNAFIRLNTHNIDETSLQSSLLETNPPSILSNTDRFIGNYSNNSSNIITNIDENIYSSSLQLNNITTSGLNHPVSMSGDNEGYGWDLVIAFPNLTVDNNLVTEEIFNKLINIGFKVYVFRTVTNDAIIMKVKVEMNLLKILADHQGYRFKIDDNFLAKKIDNINDPISYNREVSVYHPYEFIYDKYSLAKSDIFANAHGYKHPFSDLARIQIIMDAIRCKDTDSKFYCDINLSLLKANGSILDYFTIHDDDKRDELSKTWFSLRTHPWNQPIDDIKDYFGEKIALYFEFIGHYTTWLFYLSIGSIFVIILTSIEIVVENDFAKVQNSSVIMPFYTFFVCLWAQLFLEYWKRKQVIKSMEWGTTEFEKEESRRSTFYGEQINSFITGEKILFFSDQSRKKLFLYSNAVILGMIVIVLVFIAIIFYLQIFLSMKFDDDGMKTYINYTINLCLALQINFFNMYCDNLAERLTENENHRTDTEYEDSFIQKQFTFNFVNSYISLFYIAFIKVNVGNTCTNGCMIELAESLGTIFIVNLVIGKVKIFSKLYWNNRSKKEKKKSIFNNKKKSRRSVFKDKYFSKSEESMLLEHYDSMVDTVNNYSELIIQFGYVTLFVGSFPLAPIVAYLSNLIEFRTDGWQLLYMMKRPIPNCAEDIGSWMSILQIVAYVSVITNAALICFTMKLFQASPQGLVWIFISYQYIILIIMQAFDYYIDDIPSEVVIQIQRQNYLCKRAEIYMLLNNEIDKTSMYDIKINKNECNFIIHDNDDILETFLCN